jgi:hypothetical protein
MWRREAEREILLVANPGAAAAAGDLMVPRGGAVSIWDPETGTVGHVGARALGEFVSLEVPAESARFVVVEGPME